MRVLVVAVVVEEGNPLLKLQFPYPLEILSA